MNIETHNENIVSIGGGVAAVLRKKTALCRVRLLFMSHYQGEGEKFYSTAGNVIVQYLETE